MLDRLYKSEKQVADLKDTIEALQNSAESLKDKKIVELVKKNKQLQIQNESIKTKAAKAAEYALEMRKENEMSKSQMQSEGMMTGGESVFPSTGGSPADSEKRLKEMEKRITKMRNENQEQKILIEKATRLLEREIGEVVDINELSKEESTWKGRSQKVELLKAQVKKLKSQMGFGEQSVMTDGLSVISESTVFTGKVTHAEKNLSKVADKKREDMDKLKYQLDEQKEELLEVKKKYKAALARRDTLENQMKNIKTEFGTKIKMLLDKAENDDKLVQMLKGEIGRLENLKGVKSTLKQADDIAAKQVNDKNMINLKRENTNLLNQVKCQEIELE